MVTTDPIADMLTRIRNAAMARHENVDIPSSSIKAEILKILKEEGYIRDFEVIKDKKQGVIKVHLKYDSSKKGIMSSIRRVSKPGLRVYMKKDEIPSILSGLGTAVLSTSKGILTDKKARELGLGGELICTIY
ncbi:MAG: 30S ribosomal protein S8 [Deltaproteobacteria bacterium GWC2_42_11]|nr:MAG: 30S ribosomal protein S8 [Deltaproteobacteria bacterium GWC2_42_11]HBO85234.1 30S ribosomal protein S8 [Deltaproteobacteria bacterium]